MSQQDIRFILRRLLSQRDDGVQLEDIYATGGDDIAFVLDLAVRAGMRCDLSGLLTGRLSKADLVKMLDAEVARGAARMRGQLLERLIMGADQAPLRFDLDPDKDLAARRRLASLLAPDPDAPPSERAARSEDG
jgi:hypothetical protein